MADPFTSRELPDAQRALPQNSPAQASRPSRSNTNNAFAGDDESEDEEDPAPKFDVYKDFNNTGARYVNIVGNPDETLEKEDSQSTPRPTEPERKPMEEFLLEKNSRTKSKSKSDESPTALPSRGQRRAPWENPKSLRKRWGWRMGVVITFVALMILGVAIYFVIPRQPFISFARPITFAGDSASAQFSDSKPTNFSFDARLSLYLDGRSSYIPARLSNFQVYVNDLGSTPDAVLVGYGQLKHAFTVGTKTLTDLQVDVLFKYAANAKTDATWQAWYQGCGNIAASQVNGTVTRPSLQLALVISFDMLGVVGTRGDNTQLNGVSCPVERPA